MTISDEKIHTPEDKLQAHKTLVDAGEAQLDAGQCSPFDEAAVERIRRRGREMLAAMRKAKGL